MIRNHIPKIGTPIINNQNGIKATVTGYDATVEETKLIITYHDKYSLEEALGNIDMLHKEDVITESQKQFWDEIE